jgi:signal transduction histidine kinase
VLDVRDHGRGIAPEDLPRVFDPFFTTGRAQGGSGLGLAIVRNLVRDGLGGSIQLTSEPGAGTTVTIHLPPAAPPPPPRTA